MHGLPAPSNPVVSHCAGTRKNPSKCVSCFVTRPYDLLGLKPQVRRQRPSEITVMVYTRKLLRATCQCALRAKKILCTTCSLRLYFQRAHPSKAAAIYTRRCGSTVSGKLIRQNRPWKHAAIRFINYKRRTRNTTTADVL